MNGLKDLVGRKFRFERSSSGAVTPTAELPSATWFHSDGSVQPIDCPTETTSYSSDDSEFVSKSLKRLHK